MCVSFQFQLSPGRGTFRFKKVSKIEIKEKRAKERQMEFGLLSELSVSDFVCLYSVLSI